jgi:ketosteroid isomerase-like protein
MSTKDETEIRDLIERWAKAVRMKNLDGIMAHHSSEILMFDVPPPFESKGIEAYRKTWDLFYSAQPEPIAFDVQRMTLWLALMSRLLAPRCNAQRSEETENEPN